MSKSPVVMMYCIFFIIKVMKAGFYIPRHKSTFQLIWLHRRSQNNTVKIPHKRKKIIKYNPNL